MRYLALLRGVNLGPNRRIPMVRLRQMLEEAGLTNVATYLQSGNAIFEATGPRSRVRSEVGGLISTEFGFDVPLILITAAELEVVIAACPFRIEAEADATKVHVTFLDPMPPAGAWSVVDPDVVAPEQLSLGKGAVYMHLPNGMGRATLPALAARATANVVSTTRNWRTVTNLAAMLR